jgi:ubiquinone/menaquinone biosynthesis C-methylase UbiE
MSVFLQATQSGWYPYFLKPVVEIIVNNSNHKTVLDIGTGPGTLPQMLAEQNQSLQITGMDINEKMIEEANLRMKHENIIFLHQQRNEALPFEDNTFDVITFCSVLFLLNNSTRNILMNEAKRALKPNGKIVVLTPSGNKPVPLSLAEVWQYPFSFNNYTFIVWKTATTHSGRKWKQQKWLAHYAQKNQLNYSASLTFNNNAWLEIISKQVNN